MTIEEEFYKTFDINKTSFDFTCNKKHCNKKRLSGRFICLECDNETKKEIKVYPEITDRILLELICLLNKYSYFKIIGNSIIELKEDVLKHFIQLADKEFIYLKVQKLFEV